ncbi:unnamed protein product [Clonostachys rosea]|uniref:Uncharacterized protein n=1 Tax=Bionectria ochroleuca TaxID=29856 RepID=A0ABY6TTD5_BIOOC|nr:unnamed protein product [Clonostachys rosea]
MSDTPIKPEVMAFLRLWHRRLAHADLYAVAVLGNQGDTGKVPEGFPKGPEHDFEGLQPYIDQLNCDACREVHGNPSGPPECLAPNEES